MEVTLTPATEQMMQARWGLIPDRIPAMIAVAVFAYERDLITSDLQRGQPQPITPGPITQARLDALNALNREVHAQHNAFEYKPWHDYRIINNYLCYGYQTERGTIAWFCNSEGITVLEELPAAS